MLMLVGSMSGCIPPSAATGPGTRPPGPGVFAVLPAESTEFPLAARATTERLRRARLKGAGLPEVSKVSLEVVQLSIECVEPTAACYTAVGKQLAANRLLFARIDPGPEREQLKITVTLFDVDAQHQTRAAAKVFSSEDDVPFGIAEVVAEATKP